MSNAEEIGKRVAGNGMAAMIDQESRREINSHIHRATHEPGQVKPKEHRFELLYARQDV